jgi:hypothetical protein
MSSWKVVKYSNWLIFAPVAILALFAPQANAEPVAGLQTTYYAVDTVPPTRSDDIYTVCGSEVENNINRNYNGEPFEDCTVDYFMVHMTGFIEIPEHNTIEFMYATDDGGIIDIGGNEWGYWNYQHCTWMSSGQIDISAGSQPLDVWMYEDGGSTCVMLAWNINNQGWSMVPDEAFTTNGLPTETITSTTIQETTTSWDTTTTSTTTTTTTSTIAPSTTVPVVNVSTTSTPQIISTPQPEPTMPEPPATVPLPQIEPPAMPEVPPLLPPEIETFPPETLELPPDTYPIIELPEMLPFVGQLPEPPDTIPEPIDMMPPPPDIFPDAPELFEMLPPAILEELPPELVQALEDASEDVSLTEEQFDTVVESIANLDKTEAVALIEQILSTAVTSEQATELASNPDVLEVVTESQAEEIFETLNVAELDDTQLEELVDAVQLAPTKVRRAFESTINVFGDGLGDYVPIGSNVPVDTRRTLIAVAAGAGLAAVGSRGNRQ